MENKEPKHVYIFGNKNLGFHGHTYHKEDVKKILKTRKHLKMKKIKNNDCCKQVLSVNTEFIDTYDGTYVTCDEEEYFIEAFQQFQQDVLKEIDTLIENIKFLKFDEKEKYFIDYLITYLLDYQDYMLNGQYDDGGELYETLFNYNEAMKWFVANVLDPQ